MKWLKKSVSVSIVIASMERCSGAFCNNFPFSINSKLCALELICTFPMRIGLPRLVHDSQTDKENTHTQKRRNWLRVVVLKAAHTYTWAVVLQISFKFQAKKEWELVRRKKSDYNDSFFFYFVCIIFYSLLQADEICMWCTVKMLCVYTVAIGGVHRCMHRDSSHSVATNGNEALNPGITTNRISCNKFIMNFAIRFPFDILKMYRGGLLLFSSISLLKSVRCECVVANKEQQPSTIFKDARATAIALLFSILLRI